MQAVLQVTSGPHAGRKISLHAGLPFRIGRTSKADYAITEDTYLSGAHFSVEWTGDSCVVRDLNSSNGTFLNGTRMSEGLLQNGDIITAGQSSFAFAYETVPQAGLEAPTQMLKAIPQLEHDSGVTVVPGPLPPPPAAPQVSARGSAVLQMLRGLADPVIAVLDRTAAARSIQRLRESGAALEPVSDTGPYLFAIDLESALSGIIVSESWDGGWGAYITSRQPLTILRNHLRRFSTLLTQDGVELRLQLSNPALLRAFLPGLSGDEAKAFFGPIAGILLEGVSPDELLLFMPGPGGTLQKAVSLSAGAMAG